MKETEEVEKAKAAAGAKLSALLRERSGRDRGAPPALSYIELSPALLSYLGLERSSAALYATGASALPGVVRSSAVVLVDKSAAALCEGIYLIWEKASGARALYRVELSPAGLAFVAPGHESISADSEGIEVVGRVRLIISLDFA